MSDRITDGAYKGLEYAHNQMLAYVTVLEEKTAALEAERDRLQAELNDRTDRFQKALDTVMAKNRKLYQRLAGGDDE
jgi:uncharacterized small protein (DUF1192 family)